MSRKRLSKKQLKSDRFVRQTFDWAHWIETHRTQAIGAVGVLALLVAGFFVWRGMSRSAEETASVEFTRARQAYFAGNWQLAASDLQGFLSRYGGSSYADDARFFVAEAHYNAGQHAEAAEALEAFLDEDGESPFAENARRLLGATYQQLGQLAQAITVYQEGLEEAEDDATRISYREALARVYQSQGEKEAAANQYRAIVELDPDSDRAHEALREIAELTAQPIAVAGEPAAPAPATEEGGEGGGR